MILSDLRNSAPLPSYVRVRDFFEKTKRNGLSDDDDFSNFQESWSNARHWDRRSRTGYPAPRDEALGIRDAFVLEGGIAEPAGEAWFLRQAGKGAEPAEIHGVAVPAGGARFLQDGEKGGGLGQRAVYVGTEAADRFHGRARDQRGRVRHRHEAEAPQEEDGLSF